MSGGTLLSPQRYLTSSTGAEHTVKFPMRIDGEVAFDCVQDVSDAAPTVQSSYDDNVAYGVFNYEAAYKQVNSETVYGDIEMHRPARVPERSVLVQG